jgi:chromosome segregation ATPase
MASLGSQDSMVDKLKLKNSALKIQIQKLDKQLGEKAEMGEVLHAIDFDQLNIENQQYTEKISERNKELSKLKQTAGKTVQVLNSLKGKLTALTSQSAALEEQTAEKEHALASIKDEIRRVQEERLVAERANRRSKRKQTEVKMPQVMDYVHRRVEEDEMRKQVASWERKLELAKRGASQARRNLANAAETQMR